MGADVSSTSILLVTDRNDGGKNYSGVDFDVYYVQSCPTAGLDCLSAGGSCTDNVGGYCTCGFIPCNCTCTNPTPTGSDSTTQKIVLGVLGAVLVLLVILFVFCHRKQKTTIQTQEKLIKKHSDELTRRESQLKEFQLGTSEFGDAVAFIDSLIESESLLGNPSKVQNLGLVKRCLIGKTGNAIHVPDNAKRGHTFIMSEFAGIHVKPQRCTSLLKNQNIATMPRHHTLGCIPEFVNLDASQQNILFELLSFSHLNRWDFDIFKVADIADKNTLLFVAWAIIFSPHSQFAMAKVLKQTNVDLNNFQGYHFDDLDLDIDMETLVDYLRAIEKDYNAENPYHNAIHAADVVQTLHSLIQMAGKSFFDKEQTFTVLVAAAVHDVKHPGFNNNFQVNSVTDLAVAHNDQSVLENEHVSHAFKLMTHGHPDEQRNLNFLRKLKPSEFAEVRKRIIEAVLHTGILLSCVTITCVYICVRIVLKCFCVSL